MVQCDHCNSWWHYDCAGVNEKVSEADCTFTCKACMKPSPVSHEISQVMFKDRAKSCVSRSGVSSTSSAAARRARLSLEKLAAEKTFTEKLLDQERREQQRRHELEKAEMEAEIERKKLLMEKQLIDATFRQREEEIDDDENGSRKSGSQQSSRSKVTHWQHEQCGSLSYSRAEPLPFDVDADRARSNIEQTLGYVSNTVNAVEQDIINQSSVLKQAVLKQNVHETNNANLTRKSCQVVRDSEGLKVNEPRVQKSLARDYLRVDQASNHDVLNRHTNPPTHEVNRGIPPVPNIKRDQRAGDIVRPSAVTSDEMRFRVHDHLNSSSLPVRELNASASGIAHRAGGDSSPLSQRGEQTVYDNVFVPSAQQLAARHVMAKDLPYFSGKPEEWPLFFSAYTNSTNACGYTDAENLARLQRCLKGHALESVRSRLLLPASVPHVIATLKLLYGRPELLIHTLLQKIRAVPPPKPDKLDMLIAFGMSVQNFCDHLQAGGQEEHLNNPMLLTELVEKLPANLKLEWSLHKRGYQVVNLSAFADYMSSLVRAAADVTLPTESKLSQYPGKPDKGREKSFFGTHSESSKFNEMMGVDNIRSCFVCKNRDHRVKHCPVFASMGQQERWKSVQLHKLCRNCLGAHGRRPCKSHRRCAQNGCQAKHHPLLHTNMQENSAIISEAVTNHHYTGRTVLFRIIPVTLYANNRSTDTFAFLDDGSSKTLVEESIVRELDVEGDAQPLCLQWTAGVTRTEVGSKRVHLEITGVNQQHRYSIRDARTVTSLNLPQQSICYGELRNAFPHMRGLHITDYKKAIPRILIGSDNAHLTATLKLREGLPEDPVAVKTRLGWAVYGSNRDSEDRHAHTFHICECESDQKLHDMVTSYFSIENLGVSLAECPESEEVQRANRILQETTKRIGNRYETGLLWKFDEFEFPDSYSMAVQRLRCLEQRMSKDPVIGESVRRQLTEYEAKGYIHRATPEELQEANPRRIWYLPLGATVNPSKPSKIRIFCDAAAKVDGVSLNTMLMKGPDLLTSLLSVLFGFREYRVAFAADLMEMFHQIYIRREDRHSQRLLLRTDPKLEPQIYLMDVATFGAACSPCSAQFVKNLNAAEHASEYPDAAEAIVHKHYVDDYLDSVDSVEEAVRRALDVKLVHARGGFHLRGWLSNSREFLSRIGEFSAELGKNLTPTNGENTERVLGMFWRPEEDVFTYVTCFTSLSDHPTKRQVLRTVMKLFDPLGLLSFFVIHGKILLQDIWRTKTDWDEPISIELRNRYSRWMGVLVQLDRIRIPRCYFRHPTKGIRNLQLHVFCDASEEAYACVAYLRAEINGRVECVLVAGRSKVAPLKTVSIPRLELMAAVIGARMRQTIMKSHSLPIKQTKFWSDSRTVLAWIHTSDPRKYRQFVSCRIGEILTLSKPKEWHWVSTKDNVADEGTKWSLNFDLSQKCRWFIGPNFLYEHGEHRIASFPEETEEEIRHCFMHRETETCTEVEWARFSNWKRLWRTVAFVLRYLAILRARVSRSTIPNGYFTREELEAAEVSILQCVQREAYQFELLILQDDDRQLESRSKLYKLSPFLDENGLIRSESRLLAASYLSFDTVCPIILPREHRVTRLLVNWYHQRYLHGNVETVINEIRQRFHISNLRTLVRNVTRQCQLCKIRKASPSPPRMAPLIPARLKAHFRAFSFVGVDYFGPLLVRVGRSHCKRWVALFTCLTIRAVHLEVVHSLSTESCKMAIRRFIARRGSPLEFYSDNGTNFSKCSKELKAEIAVGDIAETFTNNNTKWIFNPPSAPHMGGAWERLVRSVKIAFVSMQTARVPNEETFSTILAEAESVVNSRPLTFVPLEYDTQEALTPNHFMLMSSSGVIQPPKSLADPNELKRSHWNLARELIDRFWRRWIAEYLPVIARRTKWFGEVKEIGEGDLVIIVDPAMRNGWTRGRVVEVIKGRTSPKSHGPDF